jgi:hypothetical protein
MEGPENRIQGGFVMQSQQEAPSFNLTPEGALPLPGAESKLKSERVQLELQLTERVQRKFREATGGKYSVGEVVTMGFDVTDLSGPLTSSEPSSGGSMGGSGAIVEAGLAAGTPDHNVQPSTLLKGE